MVGSNASSTTTQCTACRSGYMLSNDNLSCKKCQIQYCSDCSNNISSCVTCMTGFYFNQTIQQCLSCSNIDSDCIECNIDPNSSALMCSKCNNGFSVSQNSTKCIRCLSDCMTTSYSSLTLCSNECGPANYFDGNVCYSCPQNC